jgi:YidC/Oxa1 family membrane protein insertase
MPGVLETEVEVVQPAGVLKKEDACFLIALQENTPFYYTFDGKVEDNDSVVLTYKTQADQGAIVKKFVIAKHSYKIDMEITFEPKDNGVFEPRIIIPAPFLEADKETQKVSVAGIVAEKKEAIIKILKDKVNPQQGWFSPTVFGVENRYFVNVLLGDQAQFVQRAYYRVGEENLFALLEGPSVTEKKTCNLSFYCGPKEYDAMYAVDQRLAKVVDYAGWLAPISRFMLMMLKWFFAYLRNYGLAIIALTVLVRLALLPFTMNSEDSLKKRAEFDKKLKHLQQKFKDDSVRLAEEKTELIKKHGMPGLSGCLPLLLQIPIFFALMRVLSSTIELYRAPFFGWIHDLSMPDPYYIVPLIFAGSLILQAFFVDEKQRFSMLISALVFGAISVNFASGLAIYMLVSTLLGLAQTVIVRQIKRVF